MAETAIEWASHVWNPFTGCDRVSPGCANCYAATAAKRLQAQEVGRARVAAEKGRPEPRRRYMNDGGKASGPGFGFTVHWDKIAKPERYPAGATVFVNSMSDVFHEDAPLDALLLLWRAFALQPDVNWLVLTKRAERMREVVPQIYENAAAWRPMASAEDLLGLHADAPLPNVWLGVLIENRRFVQRAELLRQTPAAVRFISAEPLLGPLFGPVEGNRVLPWRDTGTYWPPYLDLTDIDWLIVGGESGPKARRMRPEWARDLRDAAQATGTAFFFKQWGGRTPKAGGRELDGRTWDEMPSARAGDAR